MAKKYLDKAITMFVTYNVMTAPRGRGFIDYGIGFKKKILGRLGGCLRMRYFFQYQGRRKL
jgi:hypothetical protein